MDKKQYIIRDNDGDTRRLLITDEQAALFYYLKDNSYLYDDDIELIPVETDNPIDITAERYHYE